MRALRMWWRKRPEVDYQAIRWMELELFGHSDIPEQRRGWKISGLAWTLAEVEWENQARDEASGRGA